MKRVLFVISVCIVFAIGIGVYKYVTDMKRQMEEMELERADYESASKTQILSVARSYLEKHPDASADHKAEIEQRVKSLVEDSTDWATIKASDNPVERFELLKKYLSYYPSSINLLEARKMREADSISAKKQKAAAAAKNVQAQRQNHINNWNKACYGKIYSNSSGGIQMRFLPCDQNGNGKMQILEVLWGTRNSTYRLLPNGIVIHNDGDPLYMYFTNNGCMKSRLGVIRPSSNMARYKNF